MSLVCSWNEVGDVLCQSFLKPIKFRSAPKGRQQMGETGFCKNLRFSAVSCENLRFPAVFCVNLRLPNPLKRASRKSAKICKNLRKCAFRVRFLPFAVSLWRASTFCTRPLWRMPKPGEKKESPLEKIQAIQSTPKLADVCPLSLSNLSWKWVPKNLLRLFLRNNLAGLKITSKATNDLKRLFLALF